MAVGDLITKDYQYELNGLLLGSGTAYIVEQLEGLFAREVRSTDHERQDGHGSFPGMDLVNSKIIQGDIYIDGATGAAVEDARQALEDAFLPGGTGIYQFVYQRPNTGKRYLYCRVNKTDFPTGYDVAHGLWSGSFELRCPDPRHRSLTTRNTVLTIPNAATNITGNVTNGGNAPGGGILSIVGPCTNPRISNQDDNNRQIRIDVTLTAADTMVVDLYRRTILVNGADGYRFKRTDNQWFLLNKGVNRLTYTRTGAGAASTMTVTNQDTWL